jgi:hypothetical protein
MNFQINMISNYYYHFVIKIEENQNITNLTKKMFKLLKNYSTNELEKNYT